MFPALMKTLLLQQAREVKILKRSLEREIVRRNKAEGALKASKLHYGEMLVRSQHAREQKRLLAQGVLLSQEEDRRQISRSLHDEISQTLAGINIKLAALSQDAASNTLGFRKKIDGTRRLVEKSVDIVHRFARGLRPTLLDDLGLIPALHAYMKTVTKRTGLQIRFTASPGVEKLANGKRTAFYRIAQSALTNVVKHAHATLVTVSLRKTGMGICMEVHDDGKSFHVDRALSVRHYRRLGLLSMRERVEMFGGTLAIESEPGKGTLVRAIIPMDPETPAKPRKTK
jgi:signal transduction histidine kinase